MRRIGLSLVIATAMVVGCGGAGTTPAPGGGGIPTATTAGTTAAAGAGSRTATASVILNGQTYNLSGGACENAGVLGWEITLGDYANGQAGKGDFLDIIVSASKVSGAQGRNGGTYWTLSTDQTGSIGSDMTGSFSGTDTISGKPISGSFACS